MLTDQLRYIPTMSILQEAGLPIDPHFEDRLDDWIRSSKTDFKLKKQALLRNLKMGREKFFLRLRDLNSDQQIDLLQNLLETPRYQSLLFRDQSEWVNLAYRLKDDEKMLETVLRELDSDEAALFKSWLQIGVTEEEFLSLLRFHREDVSRLSVEDFEAAEKHMGRAGVLEKLKSSESEESQIHRIAYFGQEDVFGFITERFSNESLMELLEISRRDGKKVIHILAQKNRVANLQRLAHRLHQDEFLKWIHVIDSQGENALHAAAMMGNVDVFEFLERQIGSERLKILIQSKNLENQNVVEVATRWMRSSLVQWVRDRFPDL